MGSEQVAATGVLGPVGTDERIEELDVVRGFALLGVFLMNIEFFNRPLAGIPLGMPRGVTGLDWFAGWFVTFFVQGKFWLIFSMLFGMGFAVMLARAERAGRAFRWPYLRRLTALAVFGAAHFLFIWGGDILFSYAVGAVALVVLLFASWKPIVVALPLLIGLAFVPGLGGAGAAAGSLALIALLALYLRSERTVRGVPVASFLLLIVGALGAVLAAVLFALARGGHAGVAAIWLPVLIGAVCVLGLAVVSARAHAAAALRPLRLGVGLYTLLALGMTIGGVVQYAVADRDEPPAVGVARMTTSAAPSATAAPATAAAPTPGATSADAARTPAEREAREKKRVERAKRLAEFADNKRRQAQVGASGSWLDGVALRAREFGDKVGTDAASAPLFMAVFLIGVWFVRSGVLENARANLRLFRNLALYGLPLGTAVGLLGGLIATSHTPGEMGDGFLVARGLATLGNLPAALGYLGLVVVLLHRGGAGARLRVLAPVGRMALTNYLLQSIISTTVFCGYGLGFWGLGRAAQLGFVVVVFALQIVFSRWWLARFRYGPMEWVWRGFTYRTAPAMRLPSAGVAAI